MLSPAAWAACSENADCADDEVCDLGACVVLSALAPAAPEVPLAVPLRREPTPSAPTTRHPGLSYAESAWNVALRNEIEAWVLLALTTVGGLNTVSNLANTDPTSSALGLLGTGGLVTYGVVTSWKGAKASRGGLSRLGVSYGGSILEQISWGAYATCLVSGAVTIVAVYIGQNQLARTAGGVSLVAAIASMGVMQAESIYTRRMLSGTMDRLDPSRGQVRVTPVLSPIEGGMVLGVAAKF
jgi:hypothetical protein